MLAATIAVLSWAAVGQNPFYEPFPAHKVIGNVYYVGSKDLASYLITTPEGHILINSGFEETVPLIRKSVESLGFKMSDVKILLASHAHSDHVAGHATAEGADRRQGLRHARRRRGHRLGRRRASTSTPTAAGSPARSTASWRTATRSSSAASPWSPAGRPATRAAAPPGPGRSRTAARRTTSSSSAAPTSTPATGSSTTRTTPRSPTTSPGRSRSSRRCPATCSSARTAATTAWSRSTSGPAKEHATNPFVDPEGYRAYVAQKEKAFRDTLAEQQAAGARDPGR